MRSDGGMRHVARLLIGASLVVVVAGCGSGGVALPSTLPSVTLPSRTATPTEGPTETATPTQTPTQEPSETSTPTPTPTPSKSKSKPPSQNPAASISTSPTAAESGTSGWVWALIALVALVVIVIAIGVILSKRRRTAFEVAELRGGWRRTASGRAASARALAAELATLRRSQVGTPGDAAAVRERVEVTASQLEALAAEATSPEDGRAARETADALRACTLATQADLMGRAAGRAPTAEQLAASDTTARQAEADLGAALSALDSRTTPGPDSSRG